MGRGVRPRERQAINDSARRSLDGGRDPRGLWRRRRKRRRASQRSSPDPHLRGELHGRPSESTPLKCCGKGSTRLAGSTPMTPTDAPHRRDDPCQRRQSGEARIGVLERLGPGPDGLSRRPARRGQRPASSGERRDLKDLRGNEAYQVQIQDRVEVCPVDCFMSAHQHAGLIPTMYDSRVCEPECPVEAILPDTRAAWKSGSRSTGNYDERGPIYPAMARRRPRPQMEVGPSRVGDALRSEPRARHDRPRPAGPMAAIPGVAAVS